MFPKIIPILSKSPIRPLFFLRPLSTSVPLRGAKFYENAEEAVKDIPDGSKLLVGGEWVILIIKISSNSWF